LSVDQKVKKLHTLLGHYAKVAVAFSGGVDSSFLLKSALDVLGGGNVLVLFGRSCLLRSDEQQHAGSWPARHGVAAIDFQLVDLQPLSWKEFVSNSEKRCYHCKLRMYKEFLEVLRDRDMQEVLLDGTNTDDLKDRRPGLQAIHELDVQTPLVTAGLDKNDIRMLSRELHLDTWQQLSSSCLATRIPHGLEITSARLEAVAGYEEQMEKLGFAGCRVRLHPLEEDTVFLEFREEDFERFSAAGIRLAIVRSLQKAGVRHLYLDLLGRPS
jgi:uncharacterized protein